jgi:hypothetical protein
MSRKTFAVSVCVAIKNVTLRAHLRSASQYTYTFCCPCHFFQQPTQPSYSVVCTSLRYNLITSLSGYVVLYLSTMGSYEKITRDI